MKVLMIEHFLPGNTYSLELGRELKKYCELSVLCKGNADPQEEGIRWFPDLYAGGSGKAAAAVRYAQALMKTAKILKTQNYDVVHVQTFKNAACEMALYSKMRRHYKKLVLTVHNVLPHEAEPKDLRMYKSFYDFCDELIVHNHATEKNLTEWFQIPRQKITVIPHGTYPARQAQAEAKKEDAATHFLQFGLVRKYKGIDVLLEAVARIAPEKREKMRFRIAGRQYRKLDDTDYANKIRELGIEDCVSFEEGFVAKEAVPALFQEADFVLFPYRQIYGSGALLMAYSYGKPVIASNVPAFQEETEDGRAGLLFENEDPGKLADAIVRAAESGPEQIRKYQDAVAELVEKKYNWKTSAKKTYEVYGK